MITIDSAYKSFDQNQLFDNVSLHISQPGFYVLWGESGCGKSTLLNIIAGFDQFDSGNIKINEKVMMVFQNYELIDELNVYDNIFLGRKITSKSQELCSKLKIDHLFKQFPNELSGGQKQRVGIARALISQPSIICCDEPTESLDVENKQIVLEILKEYSMHHIVLMATHQRNVIEDYADQVIEIKEKQLVCDKKYVSSDDFVFEDKIFYDKKEIKKIIGKIILKKNVLFTAVFAVLLIAAQVTALLKQQMFYIPDTHRVLNADMLYIETEDPEILDELGAEEAQKIVQFAQVYVDNVEYQMNIYPLPEHGIDFEIQGELPQGKSILINQNTCKALFDDNWENRQLTLDIFVMPYLYDIEMNISGVIYEEDTQSMNIYYDLDDLLSYMEEIRLPDGRRLVQYFEDNGSLYQSEVGYENMGKVFEDIPSIRNVQIHNPLYEERISYKENARIYEYLFTAVSWIVILLLSIFVYAISSKETLYYQKSFAILISLKVETEFIKKQYIFKKMLPIAVFTLIDIFFLLIIQMNLNYLSVIHLILVAFAELMFYWVSLYLSLSKLKTNKIGEMMKEEN